MVCNTDKRQPRYKSDRSAFIDILNSIGVRQHVSGPTHCRNHTLDLILSHGIDVDSVEIIQPSDDISDRSEDEQILSYSMCLEWNEGE